MPVMQIVREVALSPDEAWARLTDWSRHGDFVPLTSIDVTERGFTARTGVGRLGFDDPMEVVAWDPPRFARLEKRGRVVTGWAELSVGPAAAGAIVTWREDLHVRGTPRLAAGLERRASSLLFGRVIDGVLAG